MSNALRTVRGDAGGVAAREAWMMISCAMVSVVTMTIPLSAVAKLPETTLETNIESKASIVLVAGQTIAKKIEVPAGPLNEALVTLSRQTGQQISVNASALQSLYTPGVSGQLTAEEALKKILSETDLEPKRVGDAGFVVLPQPVQSAQAIQLEGIIISGEKLDRPARETTTSVGVVTGDEIKERQIRDLDEAIEQTANVITTEDPNSGFTIRGLNSEGQLGLQHISGTPLIGVVVDGVTQNQDATRRGARALWDVNQVEVLRGPQSTLQGRNALGGTVIVTTNDPTYDLGGELEGTVGTNGLYGAGFVLNAPIVAGQSAFRISGYTTERERDIRYSDPANSELGIDGYDTLRAKLLIEPDSLPGFRALFSVSRTKDEPGSPQVSGPNFLDRVLEDSDDFVDFRKMTADNYASDLSYEFQPGMTIRSVTAFAKTHSTIETSADAAFSRNGDHTDGKDFTQDLRFELDNKGNGLSGVAGLFYGRFERDNLSNTSAVLDYFYPGFGLPDFPIPYGKGIYQAETTSIAAYADLRYRWDRFSFLAGGRLLKDTVKTYEDIEIEETVPVDEQASSNAAFKEFLPKVGITFDLTRDQTIGLTYKKGYRTGFQQVIRGLGVPTYRTVVNPEYVDNYELSYRSSWLDNKLEFNANAFYNEYTDQQVALLTPNYSVAEIINAGRSHSYGAEFEARWRPVQPLQLFAALGLLKTKFDEIEIRGEDFSGNEYPEAPAFTFSAGALYRSEQGWFLGANVRHVAGYFSFGDIANQPTREVEAYTVVDARMGWEWQNHTVTLFAKNLFDEDYLTSVNTVDGGAIAPDYGFIGDGRQLGLTLNTRF